MQLHIFSRIYYEGPFEGPVGEPKGLQATAEEENLETSLHMMSSRSGGSENSGVYCSMALNYKHR